VDALWWHVAGSACKSAEVRINDISEHVDCAESIADSAKCSLSKISVVVQRRLRNYCVDKPVVERQRCLMAVAKLYGRTTVMADCLRPPPPVAELDDVSSCGEVVPRLCC